MPWGDDKVAWKRLGTPANVYLGVFAPGRNAVVSAFGHGRDKLAKRANDKYQSVTGTLAMTAIANRELPRENRGCWASVRHCSMDGWPRAWERDLLARLSASSMIPTSCDRDAGYIAVRRRASLIEFSEIATNLMVEEHGTAHAATAATAPTQCAQPG